jgi:selenocysteine-specific elongation factor
MKSGLMQNIIVGTAGHIDHGKTALVRALTGIDTDRLEEEKRRGISIELGFAHLDLGSGLRAGFVDVPGHERFIKNMLAGVGGIDLVLLVIAADESIKPQTREHFDICQLLGVPRGIIVLTKTDLVDEDIAGLVRLEAEEFVAGSFLEGAPVVGVSVRTGAGLDDLKERIRALGREVKQRDSSLPLRLPIDRAFSMKGFGAVVTGTLMAGSVAIEQEVEILPAGHRARVRGLQVHGEPVQRATAGQRTAVNLAGLDAGQLARGMTLAEARLFVPTSSVDTLVRLLNGAKALKHRAPVHFHSGSAEIVAEARLIGREAPLPPGGEAFVRFLLRKPLLLMPGDRFIIRQFSPQTTVGGGEVLDIRPPVKLSASRMPVLAGADLRAKLALLVSESPFGVSLVSLVARTGLPSKVLREAKAAMVIEDPQPWLIDPALFHNARQRLKEAVAAFHKQNPLLPGVPIEQLRATVFPGAPAFFTDSVLASESGLVHEGENVRLASHSLALKQDEEQAFSRMEAVFLAAGLNVPPVSEVLLKSGVDEARARTLLQMLLRQRRLIRISETMVFHASAIDNLKHALAGRKGRRFQVGDFKEWTGVSRKYAIPLLEFFDREKVTRREGDFRFVL